MKKTTLLTLLLFCFGAVQAQVSGYVLTQSEETYTPLAGGIDTGATGDDGSQNFLNIGFDFNFGGTVYTNFSVNVNGWIRLGNSIATQSWTNLLGNGAPQAPLIAAYWDDHNRNQGIISYAITGDTPNRVLEVDWNNISISTGGGTNSATTGSFKLLLHETTNVIEFVYGSMIPGGQLSASVGLNDMGSFLSVTPGLPSFSSVPANNAINNIAALSGYKLTFTPPVPCAGAPNPGATLSTTTTVCENIPFMLSLENQLVDLGISYQWQSSLDGVNYTDVPTQNSFSFSTVQSATTFYQCIVSCGAESTTSTPIQVVQSNVLQCYCIPTYNNGVTDGDLISNVEIEGTTLSNFTGAVPSGPSYTYYTGQPNYTASLQAGVPYNISVTVGTFGQQEVAVWIDYNDDAVFTEEEKIGYTEAQIGGGGTGVFPILIGCDIPPGLHRMRVRDVWNNNAAAMDPCANYAYGETEDYDVTVLPATGCQRPEGLSADDVSSSSAVLSWDFGCGHITWDVHLTGHGGEFPTGDPSHPNVESGFVLSDLDADTGYEFYVRAHCDGDQVSDWAGPFDFTTLPQGVANDDCETATVLTPGGSFAEHAVVGTNLAATTTVGQPAPTCGTFGFGGDVWFTTVVPEDGSITIEVQSNPGSAVQDTAMTVFSGNCGELTFLGCSDDEGEGAFSMLSFTGLQPGLVLYARVWEYANDTVGTFQISAWSASLKSESFDDVTFRHYPNPVTDLLNLSYDKTITDVAVYNLVGQQVMAKKIGATQTQLDLSGLARGSYLVKVNADGQSKTIKVIKE
ncbi:GEVED domain-containing protein [Flavobacterium caeni]|uniref:Por secretion system C-terminal sorting domain-containing protein n=1 Tax=Flavobacterium caeni TaxID=490189 RepID=A0A1G5BFW0_9FLAO|nr:GEVED domain-containing protein [Flavobacterium caeni]SCX89029.1 Por secretion system C-terminal sorting domain-containing protein [Flavobacterium caeni]